MNIFKNLFIFAFSVVIIFLVIIFFDKLGMNTLIYSFLHSYIQSLSHCILKIHSSV